MHNEGRNIPTEPEKELLRSFAHPDRPFSLMISIYIERNPHLKALAQRDR
jgi:hypothetical protein